MTKQDILIWVATTALLAAGCLFGLSVLAEERLFWLPFAMILLAILLPCFMLAWMLVWRDGRRRLARS